MSNNGMSPIARVYLQFMVHVQHNKVCPAMVHVQIMSNGSSFPKNMCPIMVHVQIIYVRWW